MILLDKLKGQSETTIKSYPLERSMIQKWECKTINTNISTIWKCECENVLTYIVQPCRLPAAKKCLCYQKNITKGENIDILWLESRTKTEQHFQIGLHQKKLPSTRKSGKKDRRWKSTKKAKNPNCKFPLSTSFAANFHYNNHRNQ